MIVLSIIGLVAAVWVWQNVNPIAGLIVGFLLVGGAGWKLLGGLAGLLRPSARQAYGPDGRSFIAAWEQRFGEMRPGGTNHPPPGTFQEWLGEFRRSGVSPGDWIDSRLGLPNQSQRIRAESDEAVRAVCQPFGLLQTQDFPSFLLIADDDGIAIHNFGGPVFVEFGWDAVLGWSEPSEESGATGWELQLDSRKARPFAMLRVTEPDDGDLWEELLWEYVPEGDD